MVLDFLSDHVQENFGVMDPDCYVLNPTWLPNISSFTSKELCSSPFWADAPSLSRRIPCTFFLFFHSSILRRIRRSYHCSFGTLTSLPPRIEQKVLQLGLSRGEFPEEGKQFFDTFQTISLLAYSDGYTCRFMSTEPDDIIHVCGISYVRKAPEIQPDDLFAANARFFSLCLLELPENAVLRPRYQQFLTFFSSSRIFLEHHPKYRDSYLFPSILRLLNEIAPSFWRFD